MKTLFIAHRLQLLGALACFTVASVALFGSGAAFTSTTANPANTFTAGNLVHTNSKSATFVVNKSQMKPSDSVNGTVVITNTGDIPGIFTLSQSNLTNTPGPNAGNLSSVLTVKVENVTDAGNPVTVYTGAFASMPTQALGTFAVNEARTYKFTVSWPDGGTPASATTGDNAFKLSSTSVQYNWNSVSN